MHRPALITGIGLLGPCGRGTQALWHSLLSGNANRCAIKHFDTYGSSICRAGIVPGDERRAGDPDRLLELLLAASDDALADAAVGERQDIAIVVGTTDMGGNEFATKPVGAATSSSGDPRATFTGWLARRAGERLGLEGETLTINTASASGGSALCVARDLIAAGDAHTVLVAGVDCVTESAFNGLKALRTLSIDGCRPFSAARSGIGVSEGAAALVLEADDRDSRGLPPARALLAGCGANNEASHPVAPSMRAIARAIESALADAGVDPQDVDLINAHAPGTRMGDAAEVQALRAVFGERLQELAIVSTKGALWHWQGAAGLIEALACVLSLSLGAIPPTHAAQPLEREWQDLDIVTELRAASLRTALSISSGIGGINTAAVFVAAE